jgi:hypothetical protein
MIVLPVSYNLIDHHWKKLAKESAHPEGSIVHSLRSLLILATKHLAVPVGGRVNLPSLNPIHFYENANLTQSSKGHYIGHPKEYKYP